MQRRAFLPAISALVLSACRLRLSSVAPLSAAMATVPFDNWGAITYAMQWCGKEDNACGVFLKGGKLSDCAHFVAHCLAAGGLAITNPDSTNDRCPHHLAIRNVDLVASLRSLASSNSNVHEIGLTDAIIGDIGFLDRPDRPYHAFMICEPVDLRIVPPPAVKVYAHSVSRCCEPMDAQWRQWFSTLFRITDAKG